MQRWCRQYKMGERYLSNNLQVKTRQGKMSNAHSKIWKETITKTNQFILLSTDNTTLIEFLLFNSTFQHGYFLLCIQHIICVIIA